MANFNPHTQKSDSSGFEDETDRTNLDDDKGSVGNASPDPKESKTTKPDDAEEEKKEANNNEENKETDSATMKKEKNEEDMKKEKEKKQF